MMAIRSSPKTHQSILSVSQHSIPIIFDGSFLGTLFQICLNHNQFYYIFLNRRITVYKKTSRFVLVTIMIIQEQNHVHVIFQTYVSFKYKSMKSHRKLPIPAEHLQQWCIQEIYYSHNLNMANTSFVVEDRISEGSCIKNLVQVISMHCISMCTVEGP